jgi:hypothetical protein
LARGAGEDLATTAKLGVVLEKKAEEYQISAVAIYELP